MCDLCYLRVRCLFLYIDTFIYGVRVHLFGVVFIFYPLTPSVLFELNCFFSLNIAICRTRHPFKTVLLPRCFYYFDKYSIFFYCTSTFLYSPVKFTLTIVLVAMNGTRTTHTHCIAVGEKKTKSLEYFSEPVEKYGTRNMVTANKLIGRMVQSATLLDSPSIAALVFAV